MHFLLRLDASAVFLLFFVNFNDPPRYLLLIGSKMITKHYSDGQPPHSLSTSSLQQGFCTDFNEGAGGRAAGRRKEFPSPGKCIGKVILGQNKEILSLNSGQNLLPEEEWKSINEVLYFLWVCCVFFLFVFCSLHGKRSSRFYLPWNDSSAASTQPLSGLAQCRGSLRIMLGNQDGPAAGMGGAVLPGPVLPGLSSPSAVPRPSRVRPSSPHHCHPHRNRWLWHDGNANQGGEVQ